MAKLKNWKKNIKEMNEEKVTITAEKEKEAELRKQMEEDNKKLKDSIKDYDENHSKKIVYNLTNENIEKTKLIEDITKKYEEQKKRANEKQTEIKELKKSIEKNHVELDNLRMTGEKETALRVKNEGLMMLKDEKIINLEIKIKEHEDKLKLTNEENEQKKKESMLGTKDIDENEELLSDKLILAGHEIRVRQEQMQEMIKTFTTEITQLNLSHMETFSEYKTEMENKIRIVEKENETLRNGLLKQGNNGSLMEKQLKEMEITELKNEKDNLTKQVEDLKDEIRKGTCDTINKKDEEIKNLQNELKVIADKKKEIKTKNKPQKKTKAFQINIQTPALSMLQCIA